LIFIKERQEKIILMNIINNKSSLAPLFGNVINSLSENSNSENKKLLSYKKIFNKSILWVKIYDNYLYLFLNNNKNNKFSILEPKTKVNTEVNNTLVTASSSALTNTMPVPMAGAKNNKVKISRNTIKLINRNIINNNNQEVKKEIKLNINKYIKSISKYNSETVKYQNIVYQFNKNNKGIQNSSVGINKNVFTLLESTFLSLSCLISKPIIVITPNKIVIQLFYYLNNFYSNYKLFNNNDKLQSLCLNLSKIYKKPVELELDRLHYPYYDSNILSNMIGLISNIVKLRFIIKNLFRIAKIKKTNKFINKYSIIPSYLSGFKIRVAGRLLTQRVIPRKTVKTIQRGTLARGKAQFVDSARFSNKNKRGSFSITVTMGHIFF
jgi:hypothetical protein